MADAPFLKDNNARFNEACTNICNSTDCFTEADYFKSIMNWEIDPCENFHDFVCGKLLDNRPNNFIIRGSYFLYDSRIKITDKLFEEILKVKPSDLRAFQLLKTCYEKCLNETSINVEDVKQILEKIGGWPLLIGNTWDENKFDWVQTVIRITGITKMFFPFNIISKQNGFGFLGYPSFLILIENPSVGLEYSPDLQPPEIEKVLKNYHGFIHNTVNALGSVNNTNISDDIQEIINFERSLIDIKSPGNKSFSRQWFTLYELSEKYSYIPWFGMLHKELHSSRDIIDSFNTVILRDPNFFLELENLLKSTPKKVLANYLAWNVVKSAFSHMQNHLQLKLFNSKNDHTASQSEISLWCRKKIMDTEGFEISLSALYARKFSDRQTQRPVTKIFENIKGQLKKRFQQIDWLDVKTRTIVIEKLDAMGAIINHNDELLDDNKIEKYYHSLNINRIPFYKSMLNLEVFAARKNYKLLGLFAVDINNMLLNKYTNEAGGYYVIYKNSIIIPSGLINTIFKADTPQYLNYGRIGSVIGHEIIHGFDGTRKKLDQNGNVVDLWQPKATKIFNLKSQCFIEQYNNFALYGTDMRINGAFTLDENISDNGGFKASYHAYKSLIRQSNTTESCIPSLPFTPQQMFWVSLASIYCNPFQYKSDLLYTKTEDEHSPPIARINVALSNMKEFAKDFNCTAGTKMNPEKKCILW